MKKIKLILVICFTVGFFSCEDSYKITQDGEFSESATFRTLADMQLFLNEVYDRATTQTEIGFTSIFTDEVGVGSQNAGQNADLYRFALTNQDGNSSAIWLNHYVLINYTNRFLRGAALITPTATELAQYNSMVAEARALRAFGHFQLLTYFSEDLKNDAALGVILMDRVPRIQEQLPRSSNGEIFALIEADLQYVDANIINHPVVSGQLAPYKFINTNFVNAFRARMYAYRGNYTLAKQYADATLANAGVGLTIATPVPAGAVPADNSSATGAWNAAFYNATTTTNPYRRMWADLAQGEIVFALDRSVGKGTIASTWYFNRSNLTGGPFHDMGRNLYDLMDQVPGDVRRRAFIDPTSRIMTPAQLADLNLDYKALDVLLIDKYPGKVGNDLGNDLKVFRLSEMVPIQAEALASTGNINGASNSVAALIKQIRDARNFVGPQALPVYANATEAWADILKERRVELCFEGHRYIDIKRLSSLAGGASIDRYSRDCFNIPVCTLPATDYRFTMPISIDEIIGNSAIQQNPGY